MSVLEAVYEQHSTSEKPRADRVPWVGAIVLFVATVSIFYVRGMGPAVSGAGVPFELQATDAGGQMRIHWDGRADNVAHADYAVFEVTDGEKQYHFPVSRGVLATGTIDYIRKSDDIAATLVLFKRGLETERRTVRSVSAPGTP